ncbi:hypothetical protein FJY94_07385 [Candidatus Kaiserbacteria bacterium]|nr:hypothetical protein [Candidatus Kaiserbacteria bacterium]
MSSSRRDHRDRQSELTRFLRGDPPCEPWWLTPPRYRKGRFPTPLVPRELWADYVSIGGFSGPLKMPGTAYCLPAGVACRQGRKNALLGPPNACAWCYGMQGHYVTGDVQVAMYRRFACLVSNPDRWHDAMVALLADYAGRVPPRFRYHRWHDAGDVISLEHLHLINEIARQVPAMHFWLPTQEQQLVSRYRREIGAFSGNLVVRVSNSRVLPGDRPVVLGAELASAIYRSSSAPTGYPCPAKHHGNYCGPCRACWSLNCALVTYPLHGQHKPVTVPDMPPYYQQAARQLRQNLPDHLQPRRALLTGDPGDARGGASA